MHVCFVVFVLGSQYLAKRLAGKNVSEKTYFGFLVSRVGRQSVIGVGTLTFSVL